MREMLFDIANSVIDDEPVRDSVKGMIDYIEGKEQAEKVVVNVKGNGKRIKTWIRWQKQKRSADWIAGAMSVV